MRVIICGSRHFTHSSDFLLVSRAVRESGFEVTEVVCGSAKGIDLWGAVWAGNRGIPVRTFRPLLGVYGSPAAFFVRNYDMARYAAQGPAGGAVIAVWDMVSTGTKHMIKTAAQYSLPTYIKDMEL